MSATEKTIVLTGASGGIGVTLTDYLLTNGFTRLALQYNTRPDELLATTRSVKRMALLVTMPQRRPRASISSSSAPTPSNSDVVSARHCS